MLRRDFIAALGSAAAWPLAARAQRRARVVAFLNNASFDGWTDRLRAFKETLREAGFAEGRNITIEFHAAEGDENRLATLTADLVRRRVDVIVANGIATVAAKAATSTIPVVFTSGADPVEMGMVASLNRPGGNLTGVVTNGDALGPKRLELLHEIAPAATDIGVLDNPPNGTSGIQLRELASAADVLGLRLHIANVHAEHDLDAAFAKLVSLRISGLVNTLTPIFNNYATKIGALALRHRIPAVCTNRDFVVGGSLASLGPDVIEQYHWLGIWTARILKGEDPAALPIYRTTKIHVIVNVKTAKALGLTVPETLLATADEVIE
jgi:putative tryptophan/tyrosine transport system substrate-binding protein